MNLLYLRYIVEISALGSINKASQALYVSQSTLSRAVKEIEEETGIVIFNRHNKGVVLTHEGEILVKRANRIICDLDELEHDYASNLPEDSGDQTLILGEQRLTQAVVAFNRVYEKYCKSLEYLNIIIKEGTQKEILSGVGNGDVHLGIVFCTSNEFQIFQHDCEMLDLTYTIMDQKPLCVQVGEKHPLADRETVNIQELSGYPRVAFIDEDASGINYCADVGRLNTNIVKKRILVKERGTLRDILNGTEGYYIGTWYRFHETDGHHPTIKIRCIPIQDYGVKISIICVYRTGHNLTSMEQRYVRELQKLIMEGNC